MAGLQSVGGLQEEEMCVYAMYSWHSEGMFTRNEELPDVEVDGW